MGRVVKLATLVGVIVLGVFALAACEQGSGSSNASGAKVESGTYTVEPPRSIAGAQRNVWLSRDDVVACAHESREDPLDGDGMSDSLDTYTFTAIAPGEVYVEIYDDISWGNNEQVEDFFRLVVADDLSIVREVVPNVERFELRVYGDAAEYRVYEAEPGDACFLTLSTYIVTYDDPRHREERSLSVLPVEITVAFAKYNVFAWNGFNETNSDVLDGGGFTFEAALSDGTVISANGSNAYPEGYFDFERRIGSYLGA